MEAISKMDETRMNSQKFINHIRRKLRESDIYFEDFYRLSDEAIERIMTATFVLAKGKVKKCYYCKHYNRFGFSMCKIQSHIRDGCYYHDLDKYRLAKKQYLNISILATESAIAEGKRIDFFIPSDVERKIIFESLKLFEFMDTEDSIRGDWNDFNKQDGH